MVCRPVGKRKRSLSLHPSAPVYDRKRVELEVVAVIEPGAAEVVEPQASATGQRERVDHELLNGLYVGGVWFVVENVHLTVPDLHDVNVSGVRIVHGEGQGNVESQRMPIVLDIGMGKDDGNFNRDRR